MIPRVTERKADAGSWLIPEGGPENVMEAVAVDGDSYHIGLSFKVSPTDDGEMMTTPQIFALARECAEAVQRVLDGVDG